MNFDELKVGMHLRCLKPYNFIVLPDDTLEVVEIDKDDKTFLAVWECRQKIKYKGKFDEEALKHFERKWWV